MASKDIVLIPIDNVGHIVLGGKGVMTVRMRNGIEFHIRAGEKHEFLHPNATVRITELVKDWVVEQRRGSK